MIYAIISDIHGNLEALEAVLKDSRENGAERHICLGDIVGYGAAPKECLLKIRSLKDIVCAGNHDHAAINQTDTSYFNIYARKAVQWTAAQLDEEDITYINSFPFVYEEEYFYAVHANLKQPDLWGYVFDDFDAGQNFYLMKKPVCFIGHSHVPLAFKKEEEAIRPLYNQEQLKVQNESKYIINVGSVGQPRDADPRASYCLFDSGKNIITWRRISYDIIQAQKKILDAGLPYFLAERLQLGR